MQALLPIPSLLVEVLNKIDLPSQLSSSVQSFQTTIYEDNSSALALAVSQHVTSCTCHYAVKLHFFWSHVKTSTNPKGEVVVDEKVATQLQIADYTTKGHLIKDAFEKQLLTPPQSGMVVI